MDLAYLHRLCKGDRSRMAEYIALYLREAPGLFAHLEAMLNAGDAGQLAKAAHSLQPHVHYMGEARICTLLATVEQGANTEGAAAFAAAVEECLALNEALMQALRSWPDPVPQMKNG